MKPYYQDDAVTIYHADCRDVLPSLPQSDLLLTDPPYGIGYVHGAINIPNATKFAGIAVTGDDHPFQVQHLLRFVYQGRHTSKAILWGAHNFAQSLPSNNGWFVWDKRETLTSKAMGDCELAWTNFAGAVRRFSHLWDGFNKRSERGEPRCHPTQKPVALMKWCIQQAGDVQTVVDPYIGSGTTLRAAKDLGRRTIGIEREERYCEIAAKRMSQSVLSFETVQGSQLNDSPESTVSAAEGNETGFLLGLNPTTLQGSCNSLEHPENQAK